MVLKSKDPKRRAAPSGKSNAMTYGLILGVVVLAAAWYLGYFNVNVNLCFDTCKDSGSHACTCCGV